MAFQAAPTTTANNANQNQAQLITAKGVVPSAGTWVAAPLPYAVFYPLPAGFAGG